MKSISTSIVINASAKTVWHVLTDFARYPIWNPFLASIEGKAETGTYLKNSMRLNGKTQVFTPKVLEATPNRKFVWLGSLWVKGLFDGRHEFILEEIGVDQTRLIQQEFFSGILSGLLLKLIGEVTLENFEKMNKALKSETEKRTIVA